MKDHDVFFGRAVLKRIPILNLNGSFSSSYLPWIFCLKLLLIRHIVFLEVSHSGYMDPGRNGSMYGT